LCACCECLYVCALCGCAREVDDLEVAVLHLRATEKVCVCACVCSVRVVSAYMCVLCVGVPVRRMNWRWLCYTCEPLRRSCVCVRVLCACCECLYVCALCGCAREVDDLEVAVLHLRATEKVCVCVRVCCVVCVL